MALHNKSMGLVEVKIGCIQVRGVKYQAIWSDLLSSIVFRGSGTLMLVGKRIGQSSCIESPITGAEKNPALLRC